MPDLDRIALQEQRLQFERFDAATAWTLGMRLKEAAEAHGVAVAIDIQLQGQPLFFYAMPGTTPDNVDWIRRKRNVVQRFHKSSYAMGLQLKQRGIQLGESFGVSPIQDVIRVANESTAPAGAALAGGAALEEAR